MVRPRVEYVCGMDPIGWRHFVKSQSPELLDTQVKPFIVPICMGTWIHFTRESVDLGQHLPFLPLFCNNSLQQLAKHKTTDNGVIIINTAGLMTDASCLSLLWTRHLATEEEEDTSRELASKRSLLWSFESTLSPDNWNAV